MAILGKTKKNKCIHALLVFALALISAACFTVAGAYAEDSGIPDGDRIPASNGIPHNQRRDIFTKETIPVSGIRVVEVRKDENGNVMTGPEGNVLTSDPESVISFRIYNTTTQEDEFGGPVDTVMDSEGLSYLPELSLKKDHDYIFFVEDSNYIYPRGASYPSASKLYVQVRPGDTVTAQDGPGAYNYLTTSLRYNKVEEIAVERRTEECSDPFEENRFDTGDSLTVRYRRTGTPRAGVKFRLVSDVETIETTSGNGGRLSVRLIEGVTYMVYADDSSYTVDPFPIVAKDKTDYGTGEGLGCYNHSNCLLVTNIDLYDKGETVFDGNERNATVESRKKRSTVTGMAFKNLIFIDRILDDRVDALEGKDYELISFTAVNPFRWELSKLKGMDFGLTWKACGGKLVNHVYEVDDEGGLNELAFSQTSGNDVSFIMDSLSLYPVAIEYDSSKTYADKMAEEQAERDRIAAEQAAAQKKAAEDAWDGVIDSSLPTPKIAKPKASKKGMTAKWKKLSKKQLKKAGSIKIEVQYSPDSSFPMDRTLSKYAGRKKSSVKVKGLAPKSTYYARVRTCRETGGVKHVSNWSKVKKVKIK